MEGTRAEGELILFVTYYGADEAEDFQTANLVVPFDFDIEWEQRGMGENANIILAVDELDVHAVADEMGEYRLLDVNAKILATASLWQETQLQLPTDAYLPGHDVQVRMGEANLRTVPKQVCTQKMLRFGVTLPGGYPPMEQVVCIRARPLVRSVVPDENGLLAVGTLFCDILYRAAEEALYGFHASIPFEERLNLDCDAQDVCLAAWCTQASAVVSGADQADCRVQLELCGTCMRTQRTAYVQAVQDQGVCSDQSAIVMSIVGERDDLWSLAKRFNVSTDAVLAANPRYHTQPLAYGDKVMLYRRIVN